MRFLRWLFSLVSCDHQWRYLDKVHDQDLRSGIKFWSERHICRKCHKIQTIELRNERR